MMRVEKIWSGALVTAVCLLGWPTSSSAETPTPELTVVVVSDGPYELVDEDNGTKTLTLTVINLHESDLDLALAAADDDGGQCSATTNEKLPAGRSADIKFTLPKTCTVGDNGVDLELTATASDVAVAVPIPDVSVSDVEAPDFGVLQGFLWALLGSAAVLAVVVGLVIRHEEIQWNVDLPGIADDWNFSDSWASNVGLAAAVFTGVFGSTDVLESILGKDDSADEAAIAVVSAALTAGLIGAGTMVLLMCRRESPDGKFRHTPIGVMFASAFVVAANLGFIWVMRDVVLASDAIADALVTWIAGLAAALIALYTAITIRHVIVAGLVEPPKPPPPDSHLTATIKDLYDNEDLDDETRQRHVDALVRVASAGYPPGTGTGDGLRTAAMP